MKKDINLQVRANEEIEKKYTKTSDFIGISKCNLISNDELDKETVLKAAKKKGNELKDKANELVELAKEKGTPVLEGIADDLKENEESFQVSQPTA